MIDPQEFEKRVSEIHKRSIIVDGHCHLTKELIGKRDSGERKVFKNYYLPLFEKVAVKAFDLILPNAYLFFSPSLPKTFSINPFQGQYPIRAVRIKNTPINPRTHRKTPEMKKTMIIKITPMTDRKIVSPPLTFFILNMGPIFSSF
jgi:hypothetical protein